MPCRVRFITRIRFEVAPFVRVKVRAGFGFGVMRGGWANSMG